MIKQSYHVTHQFHFYFIYKRNEKLVPECLLEHKMWYMQTRKYNLVVKRNEILIHNILCMNFKTC